jgi:hypothetical protein
MTPTELVEKHRQPIPNKLGFIRKHFYCHLPGINNKLCKLRVTYYHWISRTFPRTLCPAYRLKTLALMRCDSV